MKKLKVKFCDIREGRYEVFINEEDAKDLGLNPNDRVKILVDRKSIIAVVNTTKTLTPKGYIGLSREVCSFFKLKGEREVVLTLTEKPKSIEFIKKKLDGHELTEQEYDAIVKDVVSRSLTEIEITAFVIGVYINGMSIEEASYLTKKMAENGEMLELEKRPIFDKHSLGGVPGNKITLLIVPIVAAAGLTIPKTSSRAITSACGTADIMEVLAPVTFSAREMEEIVNKTNGMIAWGGGANLAPADDIFINVEYPLAIDPHYMALCSVMAKKYAVGANFVVIDLPMGKETKVPTIEKARKYARDFIALGEKLGMHVECVITYGEKPIGRAIGPALEAREALQALEGKEVASSFVEKATGIAGILLEAGGVAKHGEGAKLALEYIRNGKALKKMKEIIEAQGGDPKISSSDVPIGEYREKVYAERGGYITEFSNKSLVKIARAAGAPKDKGAGILLHVSKGERVKEGDILFEIFSESEYKLERAIRLANELKPVTIEGMLLQRIPEYRIFGY